MSKVCLIAAALALGPACRRTPPAATEQPQGQLLLPEYDLSADPVQNAGLADEMVYRGSVLVFDPVATPQQLSGVVSGSRDTRLAKARWLKAERHGVRPLTAEIATIKDAIVAVEAEARQDDNLRAAQEQTARAWLSHRLDEEGLNGDARTKADGVWDAYCEAKIWELALTPRIVAERYQKRPTPLQLCEDVYARRKLLTGPRCAPAKSAAGNAYFACLWHDGVMRTAFFQGRYEDTFPNLPTVTKAAKIANLVDTGELARALLDDRNPRVVSGALGQDSVRLSRIFGADFKELFVPSDGVPVDTPDLALALASPQMLIHAVEDGRAAVTATALHWLPEADWTARLTASIKDMGARPLGDLSVSDYLFQQLGGSAVPTPPLALPVVKDNDDFDFIFDAIAPRFAKRLKELQVALTTATERRDVEAATALALFDDFASQLALTANAASLNGTSNTSLWITAALRVIRHLDGVTEVRFTLDELTGDTARGCLAATGSVPCPTELGFVTTPMTVTHEPVSGALELVMPFDRDELRLDLYPNQIDQILYFYSGSLKIVNAGEVLHQGGLNLMTD